MIEKGKKVGLEQGLGREKNLRLQKVNLRAAPTVMQPELLPVKVFFILFKIMQ